MIEEGKKKVSWWGTVEPVMIGGSEETYATSALGEFASYLGGASSTSIATIPEVASAEVSISRDAGVKNSPGTNRGTSLQF
jgi:hypothetical protein